MKYSELLKLNKELSSKFESNRYQINVISNIIVHQLKEILEYRLRTEGINAYTEFGDYDNIVQDSHKYSKSNAIIIFWELSNIVDGLQYKIELYEEVQFNELLKKTKAEIDLVLTNLEKTSLVLINKFTSLPFQYQNIRRKKIDELASHLNQHLEKKLPANARIVDIEK